MTSPARGRATTAPSPPRHGRRPQRRPARSVLGGRRAPRGVGPLALVLGAVLGLVAGVGAGAAGLGQRGAPIVTDLASADARSVSAVRAAPETAPPETAPPRVSPTPPPAAPPAQVVPPAQVEPIDPAALDAAGLTLGDREAGLLSTAVPQSLGGDLVTVPGSAPAPHPDRDLRTVRVEVEAGLEVDPDLFAGFVMATLNDPRGWGGDASVSFARTDGDADLRVVLASPATVDGLCAPLDTGGRYSCGRNGHAALNYERWVEATPEFADRTQYRGYLINHEVGHLLGHPHVPCGGAGELAPLMQQQSIEVAPCLPNAWPFPTAP